MEPWAEFKLFFSEYVKLVWIIHRKAWEIQDADLVWWLNRYLVKNWKIIIDESWTEKWYIDLWDDGLYNIEYEWWTVERNTFYIYSDEELMRADLNE